MDSEFRLFPQQGSAAAERVDALYGFLVATSLFFTALICVLILFFAIRYRRGSRAERTNPHMSYTLEIVWTVVPFLLTMVMFGWGAKLYFELRQPPAGALEIHVVGKQWMWKLQHPDGKREINTLHVPRGQAIVLKMISEDVIHSFYLPNFRVKMDVLPDRYTMLWFQPTVTGTSHLFCAEYCGTGHSQMVGQVVVQEPADYAEWVSRGSTEPPAVAGQRLFERYRCNTCHKPPGTEGARGPSLAGIVAQSVPLQGGGSATVDDAYLRESMLDPTARIVAGFPAIMPTFRGQLSEDDILKLIAYLKSLNPTDAPDAQRAE